MQCAIGVPQREGRVVGEALRLVHRIVRPPITAVAVHEQGGSQQRVVQRGIEAAPLRCRCIHLDGAQRLCPLPARVGAHAVEIPARHFGVEIGDGVVLADRRDRDLDQQRTLRVGEIERRHDLASLDLRALARVLLARRRESLVGDVLLGVVQLLALDGPREAQGEIQLPSRGPATGLAEAGDGAVRSQSQPRPQYLARIVVQAGAQIDQHVRGLAARKAVAVHADPRGGGELGAHAVVIEGDGVIAGLRGLVVVAETRGVAAAGLVGIATLPFHLAADRHQQHVAEIRMAGAGEVGVREADDGAVVMPIAGRPAVGVLAWLDAGVGAELDHPERNGGAGIGMAFAAGADEGIHVGVGALARVASQQRRRHQPETHRACGALPRLAHARPNVVMEKPGT